jgi:UDP-N-acetylmuramyl pentapeptide synthase
MPAVKVLEASGKIPVFYTDEMKTLSQVVSEFIRNGDFILLKGSRGTALETLTDVLIGSEKDVAPLEVCK